MTRLKLDRIACAFVAAALGFLVVVTASPAFSPDSQTHWARPVPHIDEP